MSKISKSHSTVIEAGEPLVKRLKLLPYVEKIALGRISSGLLNAPKRIKYIRVRAGYKIFIRGTKTAQVIYVYTKSPELLEAFLVEFS
ncbi:MAG: hypothetical protein COU06_00370 [Candidatus Harrisonbacteria bacterium CG10_big_fil_rev_8_21_14_0_10_38_8]|uniref:Metal-binding protein n=1 Tax=Candidatus Harrisonbacteria bacterium CG10_big_fil_rev_8_21_14_0_10_38_8 TaxID=1974582 RepID=A0A2M6WKL5_9BACT|nr:MAG: hypothetical protein COU06_00370 [Candidatus Harrisonbacteria bacterium CG10_big_fil_rev_8_21_14_0_10_38_8]